MTKVIFGFTTIFLNSLILFPIFDKALKNINILNILNVKIIPNWLKGILGMIMVLLVSPAYVILIASGFVLYDYIIAKDIYNIVLTVVLTIISNIYVNAIKIGK